MTQALKKYPGTRPAGIIRSLCVPDDWRCTWVYVKPVWSLRPGADREGFWMLKFIHAACPEHGYGRTEAA